MTYHLFVFRSDSGLPLVPLPTVDDSYPPQKKSFLMFKFMHDYFIDDFEYFMRADDDVYIESQKLEKFLKSINSSKVQFIGQAGLGNKQEFGQLSLDSDENFCMGGPGIILSRSTLKLFAKNINYCLKHLYSTHEDVEIGRCIKKFVGIPCTWSYEMQILFRHNSSGGYNSGQFNAKEINRAITLHPIKSHLNMRKLYLHFKLKYHRDKRYQIEMIQRKINTLKKLQNHTFDNDHSNLNFDTQESRDSLIIWDFLSRNMYSATHINPKRHIESHIRYALDNNIPEMMSIMNKFSSEKKRTMEFKNLHYGYMRMDPLKGAQYILDLLMIYKRYHGKRISIPVRRHAYAIQTFSHVNIKEVECLNNQEIVNIIVPLSGRNSAFKRFIQNYKQVQSEDKLISLTVVLFPDAAQNVNEFLQTKTILDHLQQQGIQINVAQLGGFFSRAAALQRGATFFPKSALLLFLDVDMHFTTHVIQRVRFNTIQNSQVYFPIVFSQYSLQFKLFQYNISISDSEGYWRQFGFGIVALYNSDFQLVGGLNVSIQGWGMEDVNLYDKIVHSNLSIIRSVDPNLVHIYHDIKCESSLTSTQYEMCLGTKLTSLGSVKSLAEYININKYLKL